MYSPQPFSGSVLFGVFLLWMCHYISLCSGGVLYVKPTVGLDTPVCDSNLCHSLDTYAKQHEEYFKSNVTFVLLPGNHTLSDPLVVSNVTNLTFCGVNSTYVLGVAPSVKVVCNRSYFVFKYCIELVIQNLILYGCGGNELGDSSRCYSPTFSFLRGSGYCKLTSSLNFNGVLNLQVGNVRVEYGTGLSALNVLGNSSIYSCALHGAASNITKEEILPSICVEFTYIPSSALPSKSCLTIHNSIFTYREGPSVVAIFRQLHYTTYFHINNISTFQTDSRCPMMSDVQLHILTREPELVHITISNSSLTHSSGSAIQVNTDLDFSTYIYFLSTPESSKAIGDVTIASCKIIDYFRGGLVAHGYLRLRFMMKNCAFIGSCEGANGACIYILRKDNHQSNKNPTILQNVSVLYNEAFPPSSVAHLKNVHNVLLIDCSFIGNKGTALSVENSVIHVQGNFRFINNTAFHQGALAFVGDSYMVLNNNTYIVFQDNSATHVGGAIYVDELSRSNSVLCFIHFSEVTSRRYQNITINFINNTSVEGGDDLYGAMLYKCYIKYDFKTSTVPKTFLGSVLFKENDIVHYEAPDRLSLISSDPLRVCLCKNNQPECSLLHLYETRYPGETFSLPAVVVGDMFGTVSGYVYAQLLVRHFGSDSATLRDLQSFQQVVKYKCTDLKYSILSAREEEVIVLSCHHMIQIRVGSEIEWRSRFDKGGALSAYNNSRLMPKYLSQPVFIFVSLLPCPLGFLLSDKPEKCVCHPHLRKYDLSCNIDDQTVQRSGTVWISAPSNGNTSKWIVIHLYCPYSYCKAEQVSVNLQHPDTQCAFNHSGTLCGSCQKGLSLALGGSQCLPCSNEHISLLLAFSIAGFFLVFFIKILNLTVSQGTLNALILYANIVGAIQGTFFPEGGTNVLKVYIAWLNLDLGFETCFFNGLNGYWKTWLQFAFPVYIWTIAALIIVASHYSSLAVRIFGHNSVPVLSTLFLLSYAKLLRTIITALSFTFLEYSNDTKVAVWTFVGDITYLSPTHIPLFLVVLGFLIFLWLPYTVILLFRQCLQQATNYRALQWVARLKPFFDAYHGPFKDKHRYWVGLMLLLRVFLFLSFAVNPISSPSFNLLLTIIVTLLLLLYTTTVGQVYKRWYLTVLESSSIFNMGALCAGTLYIQIAGGNQTVLTYISAGFEFSKFIVIVAIHALESARNVRFLQELWKDLMQKIQLKRAPVQQNQRPDAGIELNEREGEVRQPVKHFRLTFNTLDEPLLVTADNTSSLQH